jgi:hypothetical protein
MKKKQLFIGVFSVVLVLTMVLSVYTRVKAQDDPVRSLHNNIGPMENTWQAQQVASGDCPICENDGDPVAISIGDKDYMVQHRIIHTYVIPLIQCAAHYGTACNPQTINSGYVPPYYDIITPSTGTN